MAQRLERVPLAERWRGEEAEGTRDALSGVGPHGRQPPRRAVFLEGCSRAVVREGGRGLSALILPPVKVEGALGNRDGDLPGGLGVEERGRKDSWMQLSLLPSLTSFCPLARRECA